LNTPTFTGFFLITRINVYIKRAYEIKIISPFILAKNQLEYGSGLCEISSVSTWLSQELKWSNERVMKGCFLKNKCNNT
jgi:hypothetical protein